MRRTYLVVLLLAGIFLSAFVLPVASPGVITFEKRYKEDIDCFYGGEVQQTSDQGYIVSGMWTDFQWGFYGPLLFKTDSLGNKRWWRAMPFSLYDYASSVRQTFDGGYIYGHFYGLAKTDSLGRNVWYKQYGGRVHSVQQIMGGGYIAAGTHLLRTDGVGNLLWAREYGDVGFSVLQARDAGFIMAGRRDDQVYLIKTDPSGDSLWARTYGTGTGYSVWETLDSGYVIGGVTNEDMYLVKTNSLGDSLWTRTYGDTGRDYSFSVQQTSDGGYILAGWTSSYASGHRAYLVKTDSLGYILWTRLYGGSSWTEGYSVWQTSDGGYVIAGEKDCGAYLVKTDEEGLVGIEEKENAKAKSRNAELSQNMPNPFQGSTEISYLLPATAEVTLAVFDIAGMLVETLVDKKQRAGAHRVRWDAKDQATGIYFCRLQAGDFEETRKMTLLR